MSPSGVLFKRIELGNLSQILHTPESVLSKIPLLRPPPGVTPNFENPYSTGPVLISVSCVSLVIIAICITIRIWTITKLTKPIKLKWSDLTFALAILATLVFVAFMLLNTAGGGIFGIHGWNVSLLQITLRRTFIPYLFSGVSQPLSLGLIKITVFLTYIELFSSLIWIRISCYIGIIISACFYLASNILNIISELPPHGESWIAHSLKPGAYREAQVLSMPAGAIGLALDIYLFIIPIVAINTLKNLSIRRRFAIMSTFATGLIAVIASIIGLICRIVYNSNPDGPWNLLPIMTVHLIEVTTGIIISCTPHIAKIVRTYEVSLKASLSKIVRYLCCKCVSRKGTESKESGRQGGEGPIAIKSVKAKKSTKLYPGLDISTVGGTIGGTKLDNIDEEA